MYKNLLIEMIKNLSDESCREICASIMMVVPAFNSDITKTETKTETEESYKDKRFETASICSEYLEHLGFTKLGTYSYCKGTTTAYIKININGLGWVVHFD